MIDRQLRTVDCRRTLSCVVGLTPPFARVPISAQDYDNRTALHLAAAEGNLEAVKYLVAHNHPINVRDRWGATPLDEAHREGREDVINFLTS